MGVMVFHRLLLVQQYPVLEEVEVVQAQARLVGQGKLAVETGELLILMAKMQMLIQAVVVAVVVIVLIMQLLAQTAVQAWLLLKIPDNITATFSGGVTSSLSTAVSGFNIYTVTATSTTGETVTFF
jgi:hypothetical protein